MIQIQRNTSALEKENKANVNKCCIEFAKHSTTSKHAIMISIERSRLFPGFYYDTGTWKMGCYCDEDDIHTLRDFLSSNQNQISYEVAVNLATYIGQQMFYLENMGYGISWFTLDNILVIEGNKFMFVGVDELCRLSSSKADMMTINTPFSLQQPFLDPEMHKIKSLPAFIDYRAAYYSLGLVILHCLNIEYDVSVYSSGSGSGSSILSTSVIGSTSLESFLKRCMEREANKRTLLIV